MISPNAAFAEQLYYNYLQDPDSVPKEWKDYFEQSDRKQPEEVKRDFSPLPQEKRIHKKVTSAVITLNKGDVLEPLESIPALMAQNMEDSLEVPSASSVRTMPVKALDENRRIINKYLAKMKRPNVSFTHIIAWALVKSLKKYPRLNDTIDIIDGKYNRIKRNNINIGLAVDITKKDGTRLLLVPNVKNADTMTFDEFITNFQILVDKTRSNNISPDDLLGTSVTLTNPGMIGTTHSSPRLMRGQGLIVAVGAINYPPEFSAVRPDVLTSLAVSKVVTVSNTYDHRIIQGAESAEFLQYMNELLIGEHQFYDQMFAQLRIPFEPVRWKIDVTGVYRQESITVDKSFIEKNAHVMLLINAYRVRGHLLASTNPLGLVSYYYPELDPAHYGFTIWDLDRYFHADDAWENNEMTLRDIIELIRETYCGPIGIEFMHIQDPIKKEWIKRRLESSRSTTNFTREEKLRILKKLIDAEEFENFLHTKFVGHKRFSLEGGESMIVLIDKIMELSADYPLSYISMGMAHRGRLNVIANIFNTPLEKIFDEFEDLIDYSIYEGSGDVKYHLGTEGEYVSTSNNNIPIKLAANPSHLELVNPVVQGMARALDNMIGDTSYTKTLPILVHGDAAFAGQGIVAETLNLSELEAYKTGGTIHIIVNNQIGFTTTVEEARSTVYATDIAKMIQVPIIHVNGNDPEAVRTAATFAFEYRSKFHNDVIIDLLCYRKYGHNEGDEPSYTQPLLYKKIKSMEPISRIYQSELIKQGVITKEVSDQIYRDKIQKFYDVYSARQAVKTSKFSPSKLYKNVILKKYNTRVNDTTIQKISKAVSSYPNGFNVNPKLKRLLEKRQEMTSSNTAKIDWAMAEALAFGSILLDNKEIRMTGQDSRRGTFSQRHAVLVDMVNEEIFIPLNHIDKNQSRLRLFDSPLSELAVLGYEYGYSVIAKDSLTLWEAQFGDFSNMAQPIVDQFITCAEAKWGQLSNLVMLLPHSYDGQGPEHSSARLERYLQLCADENMIVCNLSTPAQYFHALRRQTLFEYNKPLVIMTPKSMLRHPLAVSSVADLTNDDFNEIIDDNISKRETINRILLCTGKVYYELLEAVQKSENNNIAIIRIEQLYPLHTELLTNILRNYENAQEIVWVQEEPHNMGSWNYLYPLLKNIILSNQKLLYSGRKQRPATATGSARKHNMEQSDIIASAIGNKA